ncbi:MAG: hypothetical protein FWG21_07430, partial [Oscillospiraceae bacterium]|nr:hypothetical protein [Oscillospiraceae bacterium]
DIALYLDTLEYLSESNYTVLYSTDNYSGIADTETLHPMSEHEMSFRNSSLSICYIRATKNERH